jgi:hypothetical protein
MACTGVDVEAFTRGCRAPLFPGKWQVWKLSRANTDGADEAAALSYDGPVWAAFWGRLPGAAYVLNWWLKRIGQPAVFTDTFDHLKFSLTRPDYEMARVARFDDAERRACSPYLISTRESTEGKPNLTIWAKFVVRSRLESMPWPAYRADSYGPVGFETWCPLGADFVLEEVYTITEPIPVPPKPNWYDEAIPEVLDPRKTATGVALAAGVLGASVLALSLLFDRVRGR